MPRHGNSNPPPTVKSKDIGLLRIEEHPRARKDKVVPYVQGISFATAREDGLEKVGAYAIQIPVLPADGSARNRACLYAGREYHFLMQHLDYDCLKEGASDPPPRCGGKVLKLPTVVPPGTITTVYVDIDSQDPIYPENEDIRTVTIILDGNRSGLRIHWTGPKMNYVGDEDLLPEKPLRIDINGQNACFMVSDSKESSHATYLIHQSGHSQIHLPRNADVNWEGERVTQCKMRFATSKGSAFNAPGSHIYLFLKTTDLLPVAWAVTAGGGKTGAEVVEFTCVPGDYYVGVRVSLAMGTKSGWNSV